MFKIIRYESVGGKIAQGKGAAITAIMPLRTGPIVVSIIEGESTLIKTPTLSKTSPNDLVKDMEELSIKGKEIKNLNTT